MPSSWSGLSLPKQPLYRVLAVDGDILTVFEQDPTTMHNYEHLSLLQAVRRWPRVTIGSVCVCLNILLWGYDTGIVGGMASLEAYRFVKSCLHDTLEALLTVL